MIRLDRAAAIDTWNGATKRKTSYSISHLGKMEGHQFRDLYIYISKKMVRPHIL